MSNMPSSFIEDTAKEENLPFRRIFEALPGLILIVTPEFTIQGASDMYLRETLTVREEIIGRPVFEVFPDNPDQITASTKNLRASFEQVLATGKTHHMEVFRYDIPDPQAPGRFLERHWITTNSPVLDEQGKVQCILHETVNVTEREKTRQELKESREREQAALAQAVQQRLRLERLFEQAPAALAMLEGPDLVYKVLNTSYQQLFPGRQLMGLPLFEALPELKDQPVAQIIRNVVETGETFEGKEVLIPVARYEGQAPEDIYWNFIYQALYDTHGQVNGMLIFALDVTEFVCSRRQVEKNAEALQVLNQELEARVERRTQELRKAQAEAEKQKNRLEHLFTHAPAAICILTGPDLVFELVNPIYQQMTPNRQLLGKPLLEALPEIKDSEVYRGFREVYQTGITREEQEMLIPLVRAQDGVLENRYFRYIQQPRRNAQGEVDGVLVLAFEVTELVEARKAVEGSARELQLITDALPVLISYIDKEERYRFTNKAYETWFNIRTEDLLGRTVAQVLGEKAYRNVQGYVHRALAGELVRYEATMPYREGFRKHTQTSFVPNLQDGEVVGFYALVTDVSEQLEARKAIEKSEREAIALAQELALANKGLQVANQQLTHTNSDLDNFIYTASHDLKAPISNIEMLLEELLLELPPESQPQGDLGRIVTMMRGAIDRFRKTIYNLTEISKLQKDHAHASELVNVEELVRGVQLDLEQIIVKSGARIETDLAGCAQLSFSEKNLRSIVYNLLSNAIKYCHAQRPPAIKITCRLDADFFVLTVQDNGLGLEPEQQQKLFAMFRRFHDHVEGSGVGLYMVKRIVDNAGGKIEVDSTPGEGSTFRVFLRNQPEPITAQA